MLANKTNIWQLNINNCHRMIACAMQDDRLFSGSMGENIPSFAENRDEAWMMQCAQASFIHDFIMPLPLGYETLVGEGLSLDSDFLSHVLSIANHAFCLWIKPQVRWTLRVRR